MINSKKVQSKQKNKIRKNIICYFLAMAHGHKAIQQIQEQLVTHPYFNPLLLFKKIASEQLNIKQQDYIEYLLTRLDINSIVGIEVYLKKHSLGDTIECQQFIDTLLPYTPDILRNSNATIVWQVKSSPALYPQIQILFKQTLKTQIYHILNISSFRKSINLTYDELKKLIFEDIKLYYGNCIPSLFDMIAIRRWMELWVQVDQKDILNIMRWMRGTDQKYIDNNFNNIFVQQVECTCRLNLHHQSLKFKQAKQKKQDPVFRYSMRPLSKKQSQLYQRKISYISNKGDGMSNSSKRSTIKIISSQKSRSVQLSRADSTRKIKQYKNENSKKQKGLRLWCHYLYTILTGQKTLSEKRQNLKMHIQKVITILKQILMSKKNPLTKITKIIKFVDKYTNLSSSSKKLMDDSLSNLSIENKVIISIFNSARPGSKKNTQANSKIQEINESIDRDSKNLKKQIADTLKNYCLTKCKLIKISQEMIKQNLHSNLFKVLNENGGDIIDKQNLTQILKQMKIQFIQQDVQTLMRHFGDGNEVSSTSFMRVFQIQGS